MTDAWISPNPASPALVQYLTRLGLPLQMRIMDINPIGEPLRCHMNVQEHVADHPLCQAVFGWSIMQYSTGGVREDTFLLEGHSLVLRPDGTHTDITRDPQGLTRRHFVPDPALTTACLERHNYPLLVTMSNDKELQKDHFNASLKQVKFTRKRLVMRSTATFAKLMAN